MQASRSPSAATGTANSIVVLTHGTRNLQKGEATSLLFVESGTVRLVSEMSDDPSLVIDRGQQEGAASSGFARSAVASSMMQPPRATGTFDYGPGGIIGVAEFILSRPRSFRAAAAADGTRVLRLTRSDWLQCAREQPQALACLQDALLKLTCLQEIHDPLHHPVIA